ncbi:MAG: hypothetical protein HY646_19400 [Acidobacteria bacterium]|nr:hypothetical protein [Acidobacteriota bacterium]
MKYLQDFHEPTHFQVLGITPVLGSFAAIANSSSQANYSAVISHALWRRKFESRTDIAGLEVDFNGFPIRIAMKMAASQMFAKSTPVN